MNVAVQNMAQRLTVPFERGADTMHLDLIANSSATETVVQAYDFQNHHSKFGQPPQPRNVLFTKREIPETNVTIEYEVRPPGGPNTSGSINLLLPAESIKGTSVVLDLGTDEGSDTYLTKVVMDPPAPDGEAANSWSLVVLLGNLAKLLWVLGWERDFIIRHMSFVKMQRCLDKDSRHFSRAIGKSLDFLGYDLGVPRFPPLPHSYDDDTIALYHLDDKPGPSETEVGQVKDFVEHYGGVGHHGNNIGRHAESGAVGRFNTGFNFQQPNALIEVPNHSEFDLDTSNNFTVECFVRPILNAGNGHIITKTEDINDPNKVGWALSIGEFGRGLESNVRFRLNDGTGYVDLFADKQIVSSSDDSFHHLAGLIDRDSQIARLYIDGALHAQQSITGLADLTNTETIRIGITNGTEYKGIIDEIRLSSIARTHFHPVIGEGDESYRRRLSIFERWSHPTPEKLLRLLNEVVGEIGGDPEPLIINDEDGTLVGQTHPFVIYPNEIQNGACIDGAGNRHNRESTVVGTFTAETTFDPNYLIHFSDPSVIFASPPERVLERDELPPDPHQMQVVTAHQLEKLLSLLASESVGGQLRIESGYDPRASDLRAVGRGLWLTHTGIGLSQLAAYAHRSGFDYVCHQGFRGIVYVCVINNDYLEVNITGGTASPFEGSDLQVGETIDIEVNPILPADTLYTWVIIPCGAGKMTFSAPDNQPQTTLVAEAPGELWVKIQAIRRGKTISSIRKIRIGIDNLQSGQSIGYDGTLDVGEVIAGDSDTFFHPSYLITHNHSRTRYNGGLDSRRMQPSVANRLDKLLQLVRATGATGFTLVMEAFMPSASDLRKVGRGLKIRHDSLSAGRLGALAHFAGFTYVRRQGNQIHIRQAAESLVNIIGPNSVAEDNNINLEVSPRANPVDVITGTNAVYVANSGTDTISHIDLDQNKVVHTYKVGWMPNALAISPDESRLYCANARSNTITVINLITRNVIGTISVNRRPVALVHHPVNNTLYVACRIARVVQEIDTTTHTISRSVSTGVFPSSITITPDGSEIWLTLDLQRRISIMNTTSLSIVATIMISGRPSDIDIAPDGVHAYVTMPTVAQLAILDVVGRSLNNSITVGERPTSVAVATDSTTVYIVDKVRNELHILEPNGTNRGVVRVQHAPVSVAATNVAGKERAFVSKQLSDDVSMVNPITGEMGLIFNWPMGSGLGERLIWSIRTSPAAKAQLSSTTASEITITGKQSGPTLVRAVYALKDNTDPYTFEIRLKPALEKMNAIIRKNQYDLIMNVLNTLHPIGIEVNTEKLREHVIEVRDNLLNAFPDYTYPKYRVRGPLPQRNN